MDSTRDPRGQEGADLTGTRPGTSGGAMPGSTRNPLDTGISGPANPAQPLGSAEVHSRVGTPAGGATGTGSTTGGTQGGTLRDRAENAGEELADRARETASDARDAAGNAVNRVRGMVDDVRDRAEDLADRASETAQQATQRARRAIDEAEDRLEQQTGAITMIRNNPLPAVGLAFAAGFLLAGSGSRSKRGGMISGPIRKAVVGSLTAALANEARSMIGMEGSGRGGLLAELFGGGSQGGQTQDRTGSARTAGGAGTASMGADRGFNRY